MTKQVQWLRALNIATPPLTNININTTTSLRAGISSCWRTKGHSNFCRDSKYQPFYHLVLFFPASLSSVCLLPCWCCWAGPTYFLILHSPSHTCSSFPPINSPIFRTKKSKQQTNKAGHSHTVAVCCWPSTLWNLPAEFLLKLLAWKLSIFFTYFLLFCPVCLKFQSSAWRNRNEIKNLWPT